MATPILGIKELANSQKNQFATVNEGFRAFEKSFHDFLTVDLSSADQSVSEADFLAHLLIDATGHTVPRTLTLPAKKRMTAVRNSGSDNVTVKMGTAELLLPAGEGAVYYSDGTANGLRALVRETRLKNNLTATADPAATDDADAGYSVLSTWFNTSTGEIWRCFDATVGAAVWKKTTLTLDELGSAATKNVGTGASDVPQNSDLGAAAYEHLPPLAAGDALKFLRAAADESGNEYVALGNAAYKTVMESLTDTTEDRLMPQGAHGLGKTNIGTGAIDIDTFFNATQLLRVDNGATTTTGDLSIGAGDFLQVYAWNNDTGYQKLYKRNPLRVYERYRAGGSWSAFTRAFFRNNILGTVSESSGVPTGAVIERGSNANGEYVKLADGTMKLSGIFTFDLSSTSLQTVAMPASPVADSLRSPSFAAGNDSITVENAARFHLIFARVRSADFGFNIKYTDSSLGAIAETISIPWSLDCRWF